MAESSGTIAVVIAAYNAAATVARAVASALREPEVGEVVVVDDASKDATVAAAREGDDGSGRLRVERFEVNRGPSAARNHALATIASDHIAVLDADDFLLPGRFARLLAMPDWDLIADNIAFVLEDRVARFREDEIARFRPSPRRLDLAGFVEGNIAQRNVRRGELGFLKPVMRRRFLVEHGLRYDEAMRLGEDYDLYCRALVAGGRFMLIESCGYAAVQRAGSLSGQHRTGDLVALADADLKLLALPGLTGPARAAIIRHEAANRRKVWHRQFLDAKRERGLGAAIRETGFAPARLAAVAQDIAADKWEALRPPHVEAAPSLRYLLAGQPE